MAILTRSTLKNFFTAGSFPTQGNFADLIESMVNKVDDGFAKGPEEGLMLAPQGTKRTVMSLYENLADGQAAWSINLGDENTARGMAFRGQEHKAPPALFLREGGSVGIGTGNPGYKLDVNGTVGMRGRIGTFKSGTVDGDGNWHTILSGLDKSTALEVMAKIDGATGRGKYAMMHAIALCTFGRSRPAIRKTCANFGWFWNALSLRWVGTVHDYSLQIRTRSHYGLQADGKTPFPIKYHLTLLWDDAEFDSFAFNGDNRSDSQSSNNITEESLDL